MDEQDALDRVGQQLTRRELRAMRASEPHDEAPLDEAPLDEAPEVELPQDEVPQDEAPQDEVPEVAAGGAPTPSPWQQAVDWSLRHELPRELPPEPDVDDVRWEGPPFDSIIDPDAPRPTPPRVPVLRQQGAAEAPVEVRWSAPTEPQATVPVDDGVPVDDSMPVDDSVPVGGVGPVDDRAPVVDDVPVAAGEPSTGGLPAMADVDPGAAATPAQTELLPQAPPFEPAAARAEVPGVPAPLPTLTDLLAGRPPVPAGPAQTGWQGVLRRMTGGLVRLRPGPAEQRHREAVAAVQRGLDGPRTIVVINPKGGAHKTTATLLLAATFGQHRGGYTLAWDNNETRGTLGWRSQHSQHTNTAVNLLQDLDRFADPGSARVGDLDNYVRSQGSAQFDVLASDEDAASAASIDAFAFRSLHRTLSRFYRVMVVDTGNNMRASNWQAAIDAADQVVIVSTVREDTAQSAAWAVDALRATGHDAVVRNAVTVLSDPAPRRDDKLAERLHEHFGKLTRAVVDVPYDASLVGGSPLVVDQLSRPTREAWLRVTAAVADGL